MRKNLILFCLLSFLLADEQTLSDSNGPFSSLLKNKDIHEPLKKKVITLPPNVKLLKQIEITFENTDGTIERENVQIDKYLNPKDSIILTTENIFEAASFTYQPTLEASLITNPVLSEISENASESTNVSVNNETNTSAKNINKNKSNIIFQNSEYGSVEIINNGIFIKTNNKLYRAINKIKTDKIIIDFKAKTSKFIAKTYTINANGFMNVTISSYPEYYRFSILINEKYKDFEFQEVNDGYIVILK